ncbi:hypothetical protein TVAG_491200 [Trichomonas vaginalis G3]|uniref:Ubiquitin-like domain-containing protein n=1 Tax=Trichomonas vaginalis (strain ATCC PRA-98 / G3) TaxID=412133 RepID=A2E063_TRIV3|nr:ubiquitin-like family [Trichomonas vaginalis G3]EAY13982.1 hypothetical protein TVAG_491200 [Trichomonas vaginalis G3]KAI5551807.1 ubiquitin-like family [Trichomonas vaginalis G3]|eukprot:XP_001326205.1 hypothetical protein [Trichomonas vaginalis G3]
MLIIVHSPLSVDYIIELVGNETIQDIKNIVYQDFQIQMSGYFLTYKTNYDISPSKTLKELGIDEGDTLIMEFTDEALENEKKREENRKKQYEKEHENYGKPQIHEDRIRSNSFIRQNQVPDAKPGDVSSILPKNISEEEKSAVTALFARFGAIKIVYDVYLACEKNVESAKYILSQYID